MKKLILLFLFLSGICLAQEQNITIGRIDLKLGMDRDSLLALLENSYYIDEDFNETNLFYLWDSKSRKYNYGYLKFDKGDKLIYINKFWSTAVNDSHSQIFEQIIKLVDSYSSTGEVTVETEEIFEPNYKAKILNFIQGKKIIQLSLVGSRITLQETLKEK